MMSSHQGTTSITPDQVLVDIADYVNNYEITGADAFRAARYSMMDALGCAVEALNFPECIKLLGPMVPGIVFPNGSRVPGTQFELDPMSAAFNIATMIRWIDFNDAFSARDGGHPSDNLGSILATADYLSRKRINKGTPPLVMRDVLTALIKAYEIQVVLSLENSFSLLGFDYITMAKVAATAVVTQLLGGGHQEIINGVSNAWADGASLKIYRQGKNTGSRKSWAGGDVASRAIWLGLMAMKGEMGYPAVLSAKTYGMYDAIFKGQPFVIPRGYGTYAVENVMYKFVPAGMEGQTAAECALRLHEQVKDRLDDIELITIRTHEKMMRIMDKTGPLTNPADRDHCSQYVVAIALITGKVKASDFDDEVAADPRIDKLRAKMKVVEEPRYTVERLDPDKRSNACAVEVRLKDEASVLKVEVEYPLGHPRRRSEGIPVLEEKFRTHIARRFPAKQQAAILKVCTNQAVLEAMPVNEFLEMFVI